MKLKILIAEDDRDLRQGLVDLLEGEGYRTIAAEDGATAFAAYLKQQPDLVLLDVMMPEKSGYDVCRDIRKQDSATPIILLTAKGEEIDKVIGLEIGADDYITKPFGLHELRARIAAVLRRAKGSVQTAHSAPSDSFPFGSALINRKTYQVELNGSVHKLTGRELMLLEYFYGRPNEVISRNDLLNAAWGVDYFGTSRTLDQHVSQLRKKIETDPASPRVIVTVHGVGYRMVSL
ncbi:MAG: response regulator transcription factor [Desulfuromonas sp.]|nr:response regulator transcription factor [Desulfuromonas sp.]